MTGNNKANVSDRRQKVFSLLTRGLKGHDIAKELKVGESTISRDIQFLTSESQGFLNKLAKDSLPFMYQQSIEGIRDILKECWSIYHSEDEQINYFQRISALKLAKDCCAAQFELLSNGPSIVYLQVLEDKLACIEGVNNNNNKYHENRQISQ